MILAVAVASTAAVACGGGDSRADKEEGACAKVCSCFGSAFSPSDGDCVDECLSDLNSSSEEVPEECLDCINTTSCDDILDDCEAECEGGSGSGSVSF